MVINGKSSLQRAAATSGNPSSLSKANSQSRLRGGNGKSRGTETSFEIGGTNAACDPTGAPSRATRTQSAYTISGASYTIGGYSETTAVVGGQTRRDRSNKNTKSTQHFTIISSHDEEQQHDHSDFSMEVDHHHEVGNGGIYGSMDLEDTVRMSFENSPPSAASAAKTQTYLQIGGYQEERKIDNSKHVPSAHDDVIDNRDIEQMEGVIDQGSKMPLVVLDGANVAYAYANGMAGKNNSSLEATSSSGNKIEPDVRGIKIATDFFLEAGVRALVVLPQYWFREDDRSPAGKMVILNDLKERGLIVASPPTDDDDAYALTISRREEIRSRKPPRNGEGPGFVLSNDLFRDAQARDPPNGTLKEWLTKGRNDDIGPGRISYTFGDMGSMNDRGERVLDFVPNPRHPLIIWMENQHHS